MSSPCCRLSIAAKLISNGRCITTAVTVPSALILTRLLSLPLCLPSPRSGAPIRSVSQLLAPAVRLRLSPHRSKCPVAPPRNRCRRQHRRNQQFLRNPTQARHLPLHPRRPARRALGRLPRLLVPPLSDPERRSPGLVVVTWLFTSPPSPPFLCFSQLCKGRECYLMM